MEKNWITLFHCRDKEPAGLVWIGAGRRSCCFVSSVQSFPWGTGDMSSVSSESVGYILWRRNPPKLIQYTNANDRLGELQDKNHYRMGEYSEVSPIYVLWSCSLLQALAVSHSQMGCWSCRSLVWSDLDLLLWQNGDECCRTAQTLNLKGKLPTVWFPICSDSFYV